MQVVFLQPVYKLKNETDYKIAIFTIVSIILLFYVDLSTCKYKYASIQVCKYTSIQVYKYASMRIFKYANMQLWKYVSMQAWKFARIHILCHILSNNAKFVRFWRMIRYFQISSDIGNELQKLASFSPI